MKALCEKLDKLFNIFLSVTCTTGFGLLLKGVVEHWNLPGRNFPYKAE